MIGRSVTIRIVRPPDAVVTLDLSGSLDEVTKRAAARAEEEAIQQALKRAGGNRQEAAGLLGISLSTLNRRLK